MSGNTNELRGTMLDDLDLNIFGNLDQNEQFKRICEYFIDRIVKLSEQYSFSLESNAHLSRQLSDQGLKIETLEKTNYSDRVHGRFINGEFDGIKQRIEALENKHDHVMQSISDEINARLKIEERVESLENPPRLLPRESQIADLMNKPESKRSKYEYDIIRYNSRPSDEEILEKLNDFGFSGWELVLVKDWTYFIRREIIP